MNGPTPEQTAQWRADGVLPLPGALSGGELSRVQEAFAREAAEARAGLAGGGLPGHPAGGVLRHPRRPVAGPPLSRPRRPPGLVRPPHGLHRRPGDLPGGPVPHPAAGPSQLRGMALRRSALDPPAPEGAGLPRPGLAPGRRLRLRPRQSPPGGRPLAAGGRSGGDAGTPRLRGRGRDGGRLRQPRPAHLPGEPLAAGTALHHPHLRGSTARRPSTPTPSPASPTASPPPTAASFSGGSPGHRERRHRERPALPRHRLPSARLRAAVRRVPAGGERPPAGRARGPGGAAPGAHGEPRRRRRRARADRGHQPRGPRLPAPLPARAPGPLPRDRAGPARLRGSRRPHGPARRGQRRPRHRVPPEPAGRSRRPLRARGRAPPSRVPHLGARRPAGLRHLALPEGGGRPRGAPPLRGLPPGAGRLQPPHGLPRAEVLVGREGPPPGRRAHAAGDPLLDPGA